MNISTQFYEEEYLEFEKYLEFTQVKKNLSPDNLHATSELYLQKFEMFEKFRKAEDRKMRRKMYARGKANGKNVTKENCLQKTDGGDNKQSMQVNNRLENPVVSKLNTVSISLFI